MAGFYATNALILRPIIEEKDADEFEKRLKRLIPESSV